GPHHPLGTHTGPRVRLHPDEVVALGRLEEHVLHVAAKVVTALLTALDSLVVGHGEGHADGHPGRPGPDGLDRLAVGVDEDVVDRPAEGAVAPPGGEDAGA